MLEGLAAWVLNTYVGEYVENLNTDQLSIALLQGAVELENLPFRKDALKHLDLPLEVKSGLIGKITLQIPLSRLRSEPWVISIEKLYLVCGPLTDIKYDKESEKNVEKSTKTAMLDALEAKWQVHRQGRQSDYASSSSWFSYGTSMAANVLENIQLNVKDVHIRYEDELLNPSSPFACGVTIKTLSAQSTDSSWLSKFVGRNESNTMFKLADLTGFSVYCDMNATMLGNLSMSEFTDALQRDMYVSTTDGKFYDHNFILKPVTAQAQIKRRTTTLPLRSPSTPRISVDISLDNIAFQLTTEQYQSLLLWQSEFERHGLRRLHRKFRPSESVNKNARGWWQFAINCHLSKIQDRNKRQTKSFILERARKAILYTDAYTTDLIEEHPGALVKASLLEIEEEFGFDELKILREVVLAKLQSENRLPKASRSQSTTDQSSQDSSDQGGLFQRWFPGWSGWYQSTESRSDTDLLREPVRQQSSDVDIPAEPVAELEQEIMDVILDSTENSSLLRKDTVFARMTFNLSKGSFELLESKGPEKDVSSLAELQCSTISMEFESRPRTSAMKFKLAVGSLHFQDKTTYNPVFPYIISPQSQDFFGHSPSPMTHSGLSDRLSPRPAPHNDTAEWKFFELCYEKNPPSSFFRYSISIKTRPLDIVYSPAFIKKVKGFFSSPIIRAQRANRSRASAWKFESLKKKSPEQLMETLDNLLEAEGVKTRWDINLDISAPKLIIPECYTDSTSPMVVIDLGRFCLETSSSRLATKTVPQAQGPAENDDDFHTPLSTPPNERTAEGVPVRSVSSSSLATREASAYSLTGVSSSTVMEHLYERYKLDLTDMQVLLGRPQDNWRHAYSRGNSRMHILDKFTISLQLERRLVVTSDPHWPKMKLSGTLPTLTFHLNERKIKAMKTSSDILFQGSSKTPAQSVPEPVSVSTNLESDTSDTSVTEAPTKKVKEELDNKLVVLQFLIHQMSVELQSQGQALAEFRVTDVQADVSKKPLTTSLKLTVHSLLVVDALQSYGADFELLIASHKHLVLDSRSGSIRGSDAGSPISPASPVSPGSPGAEEIVSPSSSGHLQSGSFQAIQEAISSAFQSFTALTPPQMSKTSEMNGPPGSPLGGVGYQSEALITMEYEQIRSETGSDAEKSGELQILNLQFNSLDFIANQETIVEILSFFKRAFPSSTKKKPSTSSSKETQHSKQDMVHAKHDKIMVSADFKRLNILLPRFSEKDGRKIGKKVATATMSTAKIEGRLDESWQIDGSLGGLHLTDVTPEGSLYQQVFSVGENHIDQSEGLISPRTIPSAMYQTAKDDTVFLDGIHRQSTVAKALSFSLRKVCEPVTDTPYVQVLTPMNEILAEFSMASVYYTHSPRFLNELMDCMSEFKDYMAAFASSIGKAATEVAMGLVKSRTDREVHDLSTCTLARDFSLGDLTDTVLLDNTYGSMPDLTNTSEPSVKFTARMETPIIALPRSPNSYQVLLAHLGEITVTNVNLTESSSASTVQDSVNQNEEISISLRNMNLYSLDLEKHNTHLTQNITATLMGKSYYSLSYELGVPILYDTAVDLVISKEFFDVPHINPEVTNSEYPPKKPQIVVQLPQSSSVLNVCAKISPAVKLVLSKEVYEQILQTLDNLTYCEDDFPADSSHNDSGSSREPTTSMSSQNLTSESFTNASMQESAMEGFLAKRFYFDVPLFEVELRGNFGEGEQGLVDLKVTDFSMHYAKDDKVVTEMQLRLRSLSMDDLLEPESSNHRQIMVSRSSPKEAGEVDAKPKTFLSSSCPDSTIVAPIPTMPSSLPSSFHDKTELLAQQKPAPAFYVGLVKPQRSLGKERDAFPQTPPPSPTLQELFTPVESTSEDLVHIDVKLIDKKSPEFINKYNKTNRFIDVNFSGLATTFNLQTWVVLLDFLGMGAKVHDTDSDTSINNVSPEGEDQQTPDTEEVINQEIDFTVESFTLILNKPEYELAEIAMTNLQSHISKRDFNTSFKGQLGSLTLTDHSPHGELYQQKFITIGRQALEFDFFKYGLPDEQLQREYDIFLKLRMSSVRYIHTNRFQYEILAFCQHFLQLQDVLGRMRAASAGQKISDSATRGSRIKLDIEAGSPILLIPHSSKTDEVLVADLGRMRVVNKFIVDGREGTIRFEKMRKEEPLKSRSDTDARAKRKGFQEGIVHRAMTDSMFDQYFAPQPFSDPMLQSIYGSLEHDLRETDTATLDERVYLVKDVAEIKSPEKEGSSVDPIAAGAQAAAGIKRPFSDTQISKSQKHIGSGDTSKTSSQDLHLCLLDVWSVNLKNMDIFTARRVNKREYRGNDLLRDMEYSNCFIQIEHGNILREKCELDLHVERNLEGDLSHSAPDWRVTGKLSSVYCHLDLAQYRLIRGVLGHNLGEKVEQFRSPMMTHLQDPKIQTVLSGAVYKCISMVVDLHNVSVELLMTHGKGKNSPEVSLAKMDFIHSQLSYESFSDQSKDIDLVSHEIVVADTRFKTQPMNSRPNVFVTVLQPSAEQWSKDGLQMELHYRSCPISTQFTILLNNMKLMCIFDWLLSVQEFLLTDAENPFKDESQPEPKQENNESIRKPGIAQTASPLTVSRGIMTRRGPFVEEVNVPFELKLNITDTQFVVVEDATTIDTNAVILKTTAVLMYKPQARDKVMTCSLQSVEVFSCCLMSEEDTALSIVDPMSLSIELNANPVPDLRPTPSAGLLDVKEAAQRQLLLEVNFNTMTIRVSYHDMMLFLSILNSLPQQALQAKQRHSQYAGTTLQREETLKKLGDLGFSRKDCETALDACQGNEEDAAIWLTNHASPVPTQNNKQTFSITSAELKAVSVCLCLIDDCGDADVPLAEISFSGIHFNQTMEPNIEGKAIFQMTGEYYNRNLSGWEPFLETWRCLAEWKQFLEPEEKMSFQISTNEVLNLNLTSTLLEQYHLTKGSWTADYWKESKDVRQAKEHSSADNMKPSKTFRRRLPFIPYTIRNDTGCNLWYITAISSPANEPRDSVTDIGHGQMYDNAYIQASDWKMVGPGETKPFYFHRREKLRHKKTHGMHINHLLVTVAGWKRLNSCSVDKVGTYFRLAEPDKKSPSTAKPFSTLIVIEVRQDGNARKLIIIRSALVIVNSLDCPVQIKMASTDETGYKCMTLAQNVPTPVPLPYVYHTLKARPADWPVSFCERPLEWMSVNKMGDFSNSMHECHSWDGQGEVYRFCTSVRREQYPEEEQLGMVGPCPGHTITLVPPVTITNLLPLELHYYLKKTDISGNLKPGKSAALHGANLKRDLLLGVHLENLPHCKELTIPPSTTKYKVKLRLYDDKNRLLELILRIRASKGGSLKLSLQSPYWLVNKSGLPLIFRQDGARSEAAGQVEEHELARSVTPLLFSFSEKEAPYLCIMRVGRSVHGENSLPQWCKRFSLERGIGMRQLHVVPRQGNRPDWLVDLQTQARQRFQIAIPNVTQVYNIGIEVSPGHGSYRDTNIVTFAPRYVIDNQSKRTLAMAQKYYTENKPSSEEYLTALPNCKLPFHWPRQDLDQLLCVLMLDSESCNWSGGFRIDKVNSFHVNMRNAQGDCLLLKVEVVLQGPTFFILFADADVMPPPFRLDNLSEVPVYFHQSKVNQAKFRKLLKPHSSIAYAWDEPILEPLLTLQIHGGQSAEFNMNKLEEEHQLCYENFIYLAVTTTFTREWEREQLVIDCVHGNNLVFKRMENGKRSQLWRMTSSGMLEHEGSMPPRDPQKKSSPPATGLVLDIGDIAPQPGRCVPLVLKKPDERRRSTQTWKFMEDGRLCCSAGMMCVQSIDGVRGLQDGAISVLGPWHKPSPNALPPSHMLMSRRKLRPGSGVLVVRVTMEGPIRVLQISDRQNGQALKTHSVGDWEVYEHSDVKKNPETAKTQAKLIQNMEVILNLKGGLGISLVNSIPEELIYISLANITVEFASKQDVMSVDVSVGEVQIDNQSLGAQRHVMMYVTPISRKDVLDNTPALHITAHKVPSGKWNAEIFKHLYVSTKRMTVHLEERLLWKLIQFFGYHKIDDDIQRVEDSYDTHRVLSAVTSIQAKRYYFRALKLNVSRITLSMVTSGKLPLDLKAIKHAHSMTLIAFEEAKVDLDPFIRNHPFETSTFLVNEIMNHYTEELKSQAAKILGSVDFLGNPLGLFNDVTEGISGLIKDGNVGGLLKNVAHGVSNSAAKVAGSLSDGIAKTSMDDQHNETRDMIRQQSASSSDHIIAGVKGLGYGIFGGLTGVFTQPIEGARSEGVEGFFKGVGKGVIGTVTKPVAGVFDLTSGVANAVRDTSRSSSRQLPPRVREPRCCHGPGGLLPIYSSQQAEAQRLLYILNDNDFTEFPIALEQMRGPQFKDSLHVLITSRQVYFLRKPTGLESDIVLNILHRDLMNVSVHEDPRGNPVDSRTGKSVPKRYYIELVMKADPGAAVDDSLKRPQVRCERHSVAQKVTQEIKYAKGLFEEVVHTLHPLPSIDDVDT